MAHRRKAVSSKRGPVIQPQAAPAPTREQQREAGLGPLQAEAAPQIIKLAAERIQAGDKHNALELSRGALAGANDYPNAYCALAMLALAPDRFSTAIALSRRACALAPKDFHCWSILGNALWQAQRFEEAEPALLRAVALEPNDVTPHQNMGLLYYSTGRIDLAIKHFARAMELDPNGLGPRNDYAHAILKSGDLARGLELLEIRWQGGMLYKNPIWETGLAKWTGEEIQPGETLLLHAEQGIGDTIQFCRFIPAIKARAGKDVKVLFACAQSLWRLLEGRLGIDELVDIDKVGPIVKAAMRAEFHCPLMSAVSALHPAYEPAGVSFEPDGECRPLRRVVGSEPYLKTAAECDQNFHTGGAKLAIGLCWGASLTPLRGTQKSVKVEDLVDIGTIPGTKLWSLQFGPHADQLQATAADHFVNTVMGGLGDFAQTAAIMNKLDLIVSIDTACAHLAGAIGKPVFMLNPYSACWRWTKGAAPWYSTMKIFDQVTPDNWTAPIAGVKQCIVAMLAEMKQEKAA